jgi:catechol 2,3-dioxygenase-like lactoylglutathione lyase family enzyme
MRWRGINHVEFSVLDYDTSIAFYDRMFGWLGYKSFWSLDLGYRSTYYMARFPFPHSYIGIQPAKTGPKLDHDARPVGVHHIALWAKSRKEVDRFYEDFLVPSGIPVSDKPSAYPIYSPGYYAVFFDDPINGLHWELAHIPRLPSIKSYMEWKRALKSEIKKHPELGQDAEKNFWRELPGKRGH